MMLLVMHAFKYKENLTVEELKTKLFKTSRPKSALMINDRVFSAISDESNEVGVFGLTFTYSGHPVSARVASETLRIYEDENIAEHVKDMEPIFLGGLHFLASHPLVGEVRGKGLLAGVELVANKDTKEAFEPKYSVGGT